MKQKITIILMEPQMGENIGAIGRVMKNFAMSDLRIIRPRDGWPNAKAEATSANAIDIIEHAQIYDNLYDATKDIELLYASTSDRRELNKEVISSEKIDLELKKQKSKYNIGILFGRESTGLTNEEISHTNKIIKIYNSDFVSMNISHAASIICYEFFKYLNNNNYYKPSESLANISDINLFVDNLIDTLRQKHFFYPVEKTPMMEKKIRNIFTKSMNLTRNELQIFYGITKSLTIPNSAQSNKNN